MGTSFAKFMAGPAGRALRIAVGLGLMVGGANLGGTTGFALALVGVVPAAAGLFNFCLISPLLRAPFWGRQALAAKT